MQSVRALVVEADQDEAVSRGADATPAITRVDTVASAADVTAAVADAAPVDCVLVHHAPPALDAATVVDYLRADQPALPVVVATAPAAVDTALAAEPTEVFDLGADGRVTPAVLAHRVRTAVDLAAARDGDDTDDILAALTDAMPDYAFVLDAEGRYLDVLTGQRTDAELFDPGELRGSRLADVLPAAAAETLQAGVTEALTSGTGTERTYRLPAPDGDADRWFEGQLTPLEESYRGRQAVLLVAREVSERRRQAADAAETRAELRRTFERISDAVFALDDDWTVAFANDAGAEVLRGAMGLGDDATVVGRHLWEEIPAAVDTPFYDNYHEAMATQSPVSFESRYEPLDTWFEVTAYPDPDGLSVFFTDINERKRREQALNGLLEAAESMIAATSRAAVAEVAGTAAAEILGYPANAVRLYDPETALLDPVVVADRTKALMGAREPYPPGSGISGQAFADGEPVYVPDGSDLGNGPAFADVGAIYAHPLGDVGVLTVGTTEAGTIDESDRTLVAILAAIAETALERAADERELRQLQRIIDQVGGQLLLLDGTDRIDFATSGFADTLEADSAALEGRPLTAVLAATADTAAVKAAIETVRTGTEATMTVETRLATAGGERPVELEFSAVGETGAGAAVAAAVTDIRELATTRAALSSQRDRFRELVEVLPVPVTEVRFEDGTAVTEFVNAAFTEVFGYDTATLQGERVNEYIAPMAADAAAIDERLAAGDEVAREVQRETVNGSRDFLLRASTYDQEGDRRAFGIYTDITAQRERERYLTILNRVLRHNFRNDLTVIMGFAETLEANVADPTLADHASRIVAAGQSLSALSERARELEALVGTRDTDRTPVAVHPQLEAALDACEAAARATVVRDFADLPAVLAGDRLQQAFTELIANAIEHADAGTPQLTVTTGRTGDGQVAVRFTDDGPGIPDTEWQVISGDTEVTQLQHATGLGLWLVRWIVDSYNGTLSRSRNPTGTTVTITLEPADSSPHD